MNRWRLFWINLWNLQLATSTNQYFVNATELIDINYNSLFQFFIFIFLQENRVPFAARGLCPLSPDARRRAASLLDQRLLRSPSPSRDVVWKFNTVNESFVHSSRWKGYTFDVKPDECGEYWLSYYEIGQIYLFILFGSSCDNKGLSAKLNDFIIYYWIA